MAEIKVPRLPKEKRKATVSLWHVEEGDFVDEGDDVVDLEAGGDSLTLAAPVAGVLSDIFYNDGEEVESGEIIAEIEEE